MAIINRSITSQSSAVQQPTQDVIREENEENEENDKSSQRDFNHRTARENFGVTIQ